MPQRMTSKAIVEAYLRESGFADYVCIEQIQFGLQSQKQEIPSSSIRSACRALEAETKVLVRVGKHGRKTYKWIAAR